MSKRTKATIMMLALFALAATLALWPSEKAPPETRGFGNRAVPVEVAEVVLKPLTKDLRTIGRVEAWMETTLASEVAGPVEQVHVVEGQAVGKTELLVSLGTNDAVLDLTRARAEFARAKANRNTTKADAARAKRIHSEGALSDSELARRTLEYDTALAEFQSAEAFLLLAKEQLADTKIRAPFAGSITSLGVDVGEWVTKGGTVLTLTDTNRLKVRTAIEESDLPFVHSNQLVTIEADALAGQTFEGKVIHVVPRADDRTHTFPVIIEVSNTEGRLKPGMFARVAFARVENKEGVPEHLATLVPSDAIVVTSKGYIVFSVSFDGMQKIMNPATKKEMEVPKYVAQKHEVKIATRLGDFVEVLEGIESGATVIVTGTEQAREGAQVKIVGGTPPKPSSAKTEKPTDGT